MRNAGRSNYEGDEDNSQIRRPPQLGVRTLYFYEPHKSQYAKCVLAGTTERGAEQPIRRSELTSVFIFVIDENWKFHFFCAEKTEEILSKWRIPLKI